MKRRNANQVFRIMQRSGDEIVLRWQQTSREYLGPGQVFIGMGGIDANLDRMPIHFVSLTNIGAYGIDAPAKGCHRLVSVCRPYYNRTNGNFFWNGDVQSQTNVGTNATDYLWQSESDTSGANVGGDAKSVFHKYTDIKLNLYGTYTVPIHYTVTVCTMKEQVDPFGFLPASSLGQIDEGSECANMFKDWSTDLMHNTFGKNSSKSTWRNDIKIIKEFKTTIQPLAYSDQQAEAALGVTYSKAAHIKELRWFIRHDRYRDYRWSRQKEDTTEHRDMGQPGWDINGPGKLMCDVEWGKRVFLIIKATCPQRNGVDPIFMDPNYATVNGSYDMCIRNCFVLHRS